jgi:hypothetical protein
MVYFLVLTLKLLISLALWEQAGVRKTIMAPKTLIQGSVGAMIVRALRYLQLSYSTSSGSPGFQVLS